MNDNGAPVNSLDVQSTSVTENSPRQAVHIALRIVTVYLCVVVLWALVSDLILAWLSWESTETAFVSVCKELAFVIVSAIVLYWRMRKTIGGLERTRRDLAEIQERFHRAIVDAPIPVSIFAEDGQIVLLNRAWHEITGYQADELQTVDNWIEKAYDDRRASIERLIHKLFSLNDRLNEDGI